MPLKFIHTADWHLGHTYWRIGPRAAESTRWRYEAVRRIWSLAAEEKADFIVVAGDVFDSDTPSAACRKEAVDLLADAPAPVFVISGNHDPCSEGSVWFHGDFARAVDGLKNVKLALQAGPVEVACGALLFPCPVTRKYSREDGTSWIPDGDRGTDFRIGLAHGGWQGYFSAGTETDLNQIAANLTERAGLDYLALGDYHSYTPAEHAAAKSRTYYAGTPEIGARDNVRGGHALSVTLDAPGAAPRVMPHAVGRVRLQDLGRVTVRSAADFEKLRDASANVTAPEDTILRARLCGQVVPGTIDEINVWLNQLRDSLLGVDVALTDLHALPEAADFEALGLEQVEESVLHSLSEELDAGALTQVRSGNYIAGWSADEAARREALSLYYRLLREAK